MNKYLRILLFVTIISFIGAMGSCVGCISSSENSFSQYDGRYGNPHEQFWFASAVGILMLIFFLSGFTCLLCISGTSHLPRRKKEKALRKIGKTFRILVTIAIVGAVLSIGSCVGFIAAQPDPTQSNYTIRIQHISIAKYWGGLCVFFVVVWLVATFMAFGRYADAMGEEI